MSKVVYLCGPMEGCTTGEMKTWREACREMLPGFKFRDPTERDERGTDGFTPDDLPPERVAQLVQGNLAQIDEADFVVVFHPRPSTGTDMEVCYAALSADRTKKLIVSIVPPGCRRHPFLRYFSDEVVEDEALACEWIRSRVG